MQTPLDIERRFQALQQVLQYPQSSRRRLLDIVEFLESLPTDVPSYESYALEVCQMVPAVVRDADFAGTDPEFIEHMARLLQKRAGQFGVPAKLSGFSDSISLLCGKGAGLFEWVGEPRRAATLCSDLGLSATPARPGGESGPKQDAATVPVTERSLLPAGSDKTIGALRHVSVKIIGRASGARDSLRSDLVVYGQASKPDDLYDSCVKAARAFLPSAGLDTAFPAVDAYLSCDRKYAMHEGGSANLAIAALLCCAMLRFAGQRRLFEIRPRVAITGDVGADGCVKEVLKESLRPKSEAVFFSDMRSMVVPAGQVPLVQEALGPLREKYPRRELTVIGVQRLEDLFFDRRVSGEVRVGLVRHVARKAAKHRSRIALGLLTVALVSVLATEFIGSLDRNAVLGDFKGATLTLKNRFDEPIAAIDVGTTTVNASKQSATRDPQLVDFFDIDGDGINEAFYGLWSSDPAKHAVVAYSVLNDSLLWRFATALELPFIHRPEAATPGLRPVNIRAGDFDRDGRPELIVNSLHTHFPSVVFKLDARTGERIDAYVHTGQFSSLRTCDVNGDGFDDLVLAGVNNALRTACLTVLDPRFVRGVSPRTPEYALRGNDDAAEMYYVILPRTVVGRAFTNPAPYNLAVCVGATRATNAIELMIVEDPGEPVPRACFFVRFDLQLRLTGVSITNGFEEIGNELSAKGIIGRAPDSAYLKGHMAQIRYWDGTSWNPPPVTSERYRGAVNGVPFGNLERRDP